VDARLAELLALAFRTVRGAEANEAIAAVRAEEGAAGQLARSVEVVLLPDATWSWFAHNVLPRLVYHLESVKARPPDYGRLVFSVFAGEKLRFVRAADFVPGAARLSGVTVGDLYDRHGTGELRTAVQDREHPLLLPAKRK